MTRRRTSWDPWGLVAVLSLVGIAILVCVLFPLPRHEEVATVTTTTMTAHLELPRPVCDESIVTRLNECLWRRDQEQKPAPIPARLPVTICKKPTPTEVYKSHRDWLSRHPWRRIGDTCNWTNGMESTVFDCEAG